MYWHKIWSLSNKYKQTRLNLSHKTTKMLLYNNKNLLISQQTNNKIGVVDKSKIKVWVKVKLVQVIQEEQIVWWSKVKKPQVKSAIFLKERSRRLRISLIRWFKMRHQIQIMSKYKIMRKQRDVLKKQSKNNNNSNLFMKK